MKSIALWHKQLSGQLGFCLVCAIASSLNVLAPVQAQIIPDATLPTPSSTSLTGTTTTISGGSQAGTNLFHSFDQFSIGAGTTASFQSSAAIERILTRVTGSSPSAIDGSLEVLGSSADFFLLNPNGILFGPDASLNLSGSFVATTAERLQFDDGDFAATNPSSTALLSVSAPIGVHFGGAAAPIQVNGPGHGLIVTRDGDILKADRPTGLQVQPNQTLALLGGPVILDGGNLTGGNETTGAGRVAIAAVGADSSLDLHADELGWQVDAGYTQSFNDVILQNSASVETSSIGGGPISVDGKNIILSEGSTLLSETLGGDSGGALTIHGSESVVLRGIALKASNDDPPQPLVFPSSFVAEVAVGAGGEGGNLDIYSPLLLLQDGAQISTSTYGPGNGGNLTVNVQQLGLIGNNGLPAPYGSPSGLGSVVGFTSTGNGGNIQVTADEIVGQGSGSINTVAFGAGNGGSIRVKASDISFSGGSPAGPSGMFAGSIFGEGGSLEIESDRLALEGGAQISANTLASGNGGDIAIYSQEIAIQGTSPGGLPTAILASVDKPTLAPEDLGLQPGDATGNAGTIFLRAGKIDVASGARISVSTADAGNGGTLIIEATEVNVDGVVPQPNPARTGNPFIQSGLLATVEPFTQGSSGQISLDVDRLNVSNGARIVSATAGIGDAGDIVINANEVNLFGQGDSAPPGGILSSAVFGPGAGGMIEVNTNSFNATDGNLVSASNFLIGSNAPPGQGPAGTVMINAEQLSLSDQASITTTSNGGSEGNVQVSAGLLELRRGASIDTNALGSATGGNISIDADFIIAVPGENSDITANAVNSLGGQVQIRTGNLLGIQPRANVTGQSDITASSELGLAFAGSITLDELEVNPAEGLAPLPDEVVDPSQKIAQICPRSPEQQQVGGKFQISGRGGLPASLRQVLESPQLWQDTRIASATPVDGGQMSEVVAPAVTSDSATQLREAQHLSRDRAGRVQLIAQDAMMDPTPSFSCQS